MWKQILNYDYEIYSTGIIRRISTKAVKKPYIIHNGYLAVQLNLSGKRKGFLIHRLLAEYFIPNPENKPYVNHKDSNRLNNSLDNLEWCTHQENVIHSYQEGFASNTGSNNGFSKLTENDVYEIKRLRTEEKLTYKQLSTKYSVSQGCIAGIISEVNWSHVKYPKP